MPSFFSALFYGKPTLSNLEKKFGHNVEKRKQHKEPLKAAIDKVFRQYSSITKATFIRELQKKNINLVFRSNEKGYTYGTTFIDNQHKTVFNGSDLGKAYSAKGITERLGTIDKPLKLQQLSQTQQEPKTYLKPTEQTNYLPIALAKYQPQAAPSVTRKKKKRKGQEQDQGLTL